MEGRPTIKLLKQIMRIKDIDIATHWYDLGLELVDSNSILKGIKADHPNDVNACCSVMFEKWLEIDPDASWNKLIAALNNIEMKTAAIRILEEPGMYILMHTNHSVYYAHLLM